MSALRTMSTASYVCLMLLFSSNMLSAQIIQQHIDSDSKIQQKASREVLYLHMDKPSYVLGDTIWFASYLSDAYEHKPSENSGIIYVELINPGNGIEKRLALHNTLGHSFAQFPLDIKMAPGIYRIRAYSRWMRNFSDSLFFEKEIPILGGIHNWYMDIQSLSHTTQTNKDSIALAFSLKDQGNALVKNRYVTLQVKNNKGKTLLSKNITTRDDGSLNINFNIDNNKKNEQITLDVLDGNNISRISYPILINQPKDQFDVQFLPESGHLVAGFPNNIGFKAIASNGIGINIHGNIQNSKGETVASFASTDKGMGVFSFTPTPSEMYTATFPNHSPIQLPVVENSGIVLQVDNISHPDSTVVLVHATQDLTGQQFLLFGQYKGYDILGVNITLKDATKRIALLKKLFPTGISSFRLLRENGQLISERRFFINHDDHLNIAIATASNTLLTKDSVPMTIKVTDNEGKPVEGIFSIAVTDKQQVDKKIIDENILSYHMLSSEIKGTIESPGSYFVHNDPTTRQNLDLLMLTQGFVRYDWDTTKMAYPAEPSFEIRGKATSLTGKGLDKGNIVLIGRGRQLLVKDTVTDAKGNFVFDDFPLFDSSAFVIQARNKKNKSFGVGIEITDYKFPAIKSASAPFLRMSTNINLDTTLRKRVAQYEPFAEKKYGRSNLLDVTVTTKAKVEGSENLNGAGQYDQAITQNQLQQMGDSTLLQVLYAKVKNFTTGPCGKPYTSQYYKINGNKLRFVFDGVSLDFLYDPEIQMGSIDPYFEFVTQYLKYYTAKDIKGIEIMNSSRYSGNYINTYLTMNERLNYNPVLGCPYSYIEITTYGKQGPFLRQNATIDVFRPQPFFYGKAFYEPKYVNRQLQDALPDVRSTIYWHPAIITDKKGEAKLSFYSAGMQTEYMFWVEGVDLNGRFGLGTKTIEVKE